MPDPIYFHFSARITTRVARPNTLVVAAGCEKSYGIPVDKCLQLGGRRVVEHLDHGIKPRGPSVCVVRPLLPAMTQ